MDILLSHTTALEALRLYGRGAPSASDAPSSLPTKAELVSLIDRTPMLARLTKPLHLLSSGGRGRRRTKLAHGHLCGASLPKRSVMRLASGVLCVTPERLCVEMAPLLTQLELVVLMSELLGLYAIDPSAEDGMRQRDQPLMTPESLLAFLEDCPSARGTTETRNALALACVRSGSPRETKLSLRLALKPSRGGYGLNVLAMNEPLEVRRIENRMRRGIRKPDILIAGPELPGGVRMVVAVEYNGRHHDEPCRLAQDAARSNELKAIDVVEFIVRREHYRDLDYMDGLAHLIREKLGMRAVSWTVREQALYRQRRRELYNELELIDGINWNGRERERRARSVAALDSDWDTVPVEAYGLA